MGNCNPYQRITDEFDSVCALPDKLIPNTHGGFDEKGRIDLPKPNFVFPKNNYHAVDICIWPTHKYGFLMFDDVKLIIKDYNHYFYGPCIFVSQYVNPKKGYDNTVMIIRGATVAQTMEFLVTMYLGGTDVSVEWFRVGASPMMLMNEKIQPITVKHLVYVYAQQTLEWLEKIKSVYSVHVYETKNSMAILNHPLTLSAYEICFRDCEFLEAIPTQVQVPIVRFQFEFDIKVFFFICWLMKNRINPTILIFVVNSSQKMSLAIARHLVHKGFKRSHVEGMLSITVPINKFKIDGQAIELNVGFQGRTVALRIMPKGSGRELDWKIKAGII